MIPFDLIGAMVILCLIFLVALWLEFSTKSLKVRSLGKMIRKIDQKEHILFSPEVKAEAESKKQNAILSEDGDIRAAFLKLSNEIESSLRTIVLPFSDDAYALSGPRMMGILIEKRLLARTFGEALEHIWRIRERLIHGGMSNPAELTMANELAVVLLSVLYSLDVKMGEKKSLL